MITYHVEADNEPTPPSEPRWLVKRQPPEGWMPMPFHLESDADRYTAWLSACNAPEAPTLPTAPSTVPRDQASFEDAIVAAQQTVNLNMSDPQAYIHLSNLLEQRDRPDEAVTVLREALARLFQVTRLYEALVQLLVRQGRLDDAIDVAVSVTGVEAENPQTYALLGHLLTRAGRYGDAEVAIRRALELEPQQIGFFQLLINVLEGMGNLDAAIEAARRVIELQPTSPDAWLRLGEVLRGVDRHAEAEAAVRRAIEIAPEAARPYHDLSYVLECRGDLGGALQASRHAVELDPMVVHFHFQHSRLLSRCGEIELAIAAARQAIALNAADAGLHAHLGQLLARTDQLGEAEAAILQALRLEPERPGLDGVLAGISFARRTKDRQRRNKMRIPGFHVPDLERTVADHKPESMFHRLATAELALSREEYDAAKQGLTSVAKDFLVTNDAQHRDIKLHLIAALIAVGEFASASRVAKHAYGLVCQIATLDPLPATRPSEPHRLDHAVLLVMEKGRCTIYLNQHIFEIESGFHAVERLCGYFDFLAKYLRSDYAVTGSVYLNLGDGGVVPGLVGGDFREGYFPIPDPLYCRANGYEFVKNRSKASFVPWEQRIPKVVWRGTCSGDLSRGDWRSLQRVRLCEIGSTSELFDVGLGDYLVGHDERTVAEIKGSGLMRPRLPSFLRYKYQIDVPGNGNSPSWSGLINKLAMGSALLQVASWSVGFKLSYSDRLKPWFHFVPVAADLSDLVEKAEWLKNHDEQARQIGLQGQELAYSLEYETELQLAFKTVQAAIAHHSYAFRE